MPGAGWEEGQGRPRPPRQRRWGGSGQGVRVSVVTWWWGERSRMPSSHLPSECWQSKKPPPRTSRSGRGNRRRRSRERRRKRARKRREEELTGKTGCPEAEVLPTPRRQRRYQQRSPSRPPRSSRPQPQEGNLGSSTPLMCRPRCRVPSSRSRRRPRPR